MSTKMLVIPNKTLLIFSKVLAIMWFKGAKTPHPLIPSKMLAGIIEENCMGPGASIRRIFP
jgi:hypothetical protein